MKNTIKNKANLGYKQTTIGLIPVDWEVKRLGEICSTFKSGNGITSETISESGEYAVYGGNGVRGFTKSFTHEGNFLLIGRQGALCGNIFQISGKNYISEHAIAVQTNTENYNSYLAYKLDFFNLNRLSESSAQPGLSVEKLVRIKLPIPPLPEQQKIATILSTWDAAIDNCKAIIEKLQQRNKGLEYFVFSKSFLRKDYSEVLLEDVTDKIGDGLHGTPSYVSNSKYFFINGNNIANNCLTITENTKCISKEEFDLHKKDLGENTILFSINGTIGNLSFYNKQNVALGKSIAYLNCKADVSKFFIFYWLNSSHVKNFIEQELTGSTIRNLSLKSIRNITIKIPKKEVQNKIVNILDTATTELTHYQQKLQALQLQKKGLMQQLLTGKVRVKV